jgi:lysine 2,3-aminomutase
MSQALRAYKNDEQDDRNAAYQQLAKAVGLLPIKVTPFYQKKVDEEVAVLGHCQGPLHNVVYPAPERLLARTKIEIKDWVGDHTHMPDEGQGAFLHKYPDRVLFMVTPHCAAHCLYCFRQDTLVEQKEGALTLDRKIAALVRYVEAHPGVREVILSGGDPLTLPFAELEKILHALSRISTVEIIRIHSRAPIFAPHVLKDDAKIKLLAQHHVRFIFHVVHPYEVCADVADVFARMHAAGIALYNQFPLLRKINDHADVLTQLLRTLDQHHVRTISIFVPEPVPYSSAYRMRYERMCALIDEVQQQSPPWLAAFRFCLDTPLGKMRREHLILRERDADKLVFTYEGEKITYPDFPESLDEPGKRDTLLWKDNG